MSETISTAEALLGDLTGFQSFCNEGRGLGEELREYQREQLDQWSRQTLAAIDHPSEPLRFTDREMKKLPPSIASNFPVACIYLIHLFKYKLMCSIQTGEDSVISVKVNLTEGSCVRVVSISIPFSLETSGRLMEFDGRDGKLRVHYSDRLVALLREVRQLSALGLSVPTKITTTAQTARKFYRHGVVLKQVYIYH